VRVGGGGWNGMRGRRQSETGEPARACVGSSQRRRTGAVEMGDRGGSSAAEWPTAGVQRPMHVEVLERDEALSTLATREQLRLRLLRRRRHARQLRLTTTKHIHLLTTTTTICLQCFDAVGWAAGRASENLNKFRSQLRPLASSTHLL